MRMAPAQFVNIVAGGLALTACRTPAASYKIDSGIRPSPPHVGPVAVSLRVTDSNSKPVTGARLELEGDMSHAGMAPVFGPAREIEPGRYQGSLTLTMAGDWVILVHGRLPDGELLEHQIPLTGVR